MLFHPLVSQSLEYHYVRSSLFTPRFILFSCELQGVNKNGAIKREICSKMLFHFVFYYVHLHHQVFSMQRISLSLYPWYLLMAAGWRSLISNVLLLMSFDPLPGMCRALGKAAKRPSSHMMVEGGKKKQMTFSFSLQQSAKKWWNMNYALVFWGLKEKKSKRVFFFPLFPSTRNRWMNCYYRTRRRQDKIKGHW